MSIILITHVVVALSSVAYATYAFFNPTHDRLRFSYLLVASTIFSGTYLAIGAPEHLLRTCLTGLAYTSVVTVITVAAHRRLATESVKSKRQQ
jgi:hypothetical protein